MTARDRAEQAATAALKHRLQNRGDGEGQYPLDDELFAREYVTSLVGFGWRWVEALTRHRHAAGDGRPVSEETRREVEEARRAFDVARERQRAEAAARTEGDAA